MIEQSGQVVALEPAAVWVQTRRQTTCASCVANAGCGQGLRDKLGLADSDGVIRVPTDLHLQVGDEVVIGIREEGLLQSAALVYLLPLLLFFAAAGTLQALGASEPEIILAGGAGLAAGAGVLRWLNRRFEHNPALQPRLLHAVLARSGATE